MSGFDNFINIHRANVTAFLEHLLFKSSMVLACRIFSTYYSYSNCSKKREDKSWVLICLVLWHKERRIREERISVISCTCGNLYYDLWLYETWVCTTPWSLISSPNSILTYISLFDTLDNISHKRRHLRHNSIHARSHPIAEKLRKAIM